MTSEQLEVTIARIDERLGTLTTNYAELKTDFGSLKTSVQTLHDTAIRFGNSLERTRHEMVMKADCVETQDNIVALLPCPDGHCKWELADKERRTENRTSRITIRDALYISLFTIPIVLLTTILSNILPFSK